MATTPFTALRRIAGAAFTLTLLSLCLTGAAFGQNASAPLVTASAPVGLNHPTGWKTILQTAIDSNGDWLVDEYPDGGLFEFPAGCSAADSTSGGPSCMITLVPLGGLNTGYANDMVLLDPDNNLYVGGNWNNCILEFPYNSAADSWPTLSVLTPTNPSPDECGVAPYSFAQYNIFGFSPGYFQPWGVAIGNSNTFAGGAPNIIVGNNNVPGFIFSMGVSGAWSNPSVPQNSSSTYEILASAEVREDSLAVDPAGNIYMVESSGGLSGVYEIPQSIVAAGEAAGTAGVTTTDTSSGIVRVDPNLPDVTGVVTDAAGNLYVSDGDDGVFMIPNANPTAGGTPDTAATVLLSPVPAQGEVAIDPVRNILYVPTTQTQNNGEADVAKVGISHAEFGSPAVGTATAALPIDFSFNGSVTPASFAIVEDGMTTPEFAISGGNCNTGTAYATQSSCYENVTFTPAAVGSAEAKLLMLDSNGNILASMALHGTGTGAEAQVAGGVESVIGSTLKAPTQVTTDSSGNVYVADPGQGKVLEYHAGSSTPISVPPAACAVGCTNGLVSPTGVAVDGAGDLFIADSGASGGGTVYEVPFGQHGMDAPGKTTLVSGLGTNLSLAVDGLGDLYIADPTNGRVVKLSGIGMTGVGALVESTTYLTTGVTSSVPSAIAVDSNNNLYVFDSTSGDLYEFAGGLGTPTTLMTGLSGVTGLAVDPSGAVYISSSSGTMRYPIVSSVVGAGSPIAPDVTDSSSVALDRSGNVYITPAAGPGVTLVSTIGTLAVGTPGSLTSSSSATTTITNAGNAPLTVTGYTNSTINDDSVTVANFTGADGTCVADSTSPGTGVAPGAACQAVVTFDPGPGQQGTLTGEVYATSNAFNAPITIDATATGLALASATSAVSVATTAQVIDTPVTVTVTPPSGSTVTPTGTVQVTYPTWTVIMTCTPTPPATTCTAIPTINPVTATASATLSPTTNGQAQAQLTLAPVLSSIANGGADTFKVGYAGDRVYGELTATQTATVAQSPISGFIADQNPPSYLPFVQEQSGSTPYDTSQAHWQYTMPVTVNTAAGIPTGTLTFNDNSSTCPPGTSATGQGATMCALSDTNGVACPQSLGIGTPYVLNNGTPSAFAGASATFPTSCLQMPEFTTYTPVVSTHYITPVYSGDANFLGATDPVSSLFQVLRSSLVYITTSIPSASSPIPTTPISTPSLSVQPGSTASMTLYLAPLLGYGFEGKNAILNDYNFPVTLGCDNLPPHTQCTFTYPSIISSYQPSAPNSVQICPEPTLTSNTLTSTAFETLAETGGCNSDGTGVVTLTINTNVSVGTTTTTSQNTAPSITLASIFGLGLIGLFFRRRQFEKGRRLLMVLLMVVGGALAVSLSACNTTNLTPLAKLSTPAGTYAVNITATQVGTQCVQQSTPSIPCTTASGQPGTVVVGSENPVSLPYYFNLTVQ